MKTDEKELKCEEAIRMLMEYLDRELGEADARAMEKHLSTCRACFSRKEFEQRLAGIVREVKSEPASDTLKERVQKLFEDF